MAGDKLFTLLLGLSVTSVVVNLPNTANAQDNVIRKHQGFGGQLEGHTIMRIRKRRKLRPAFHNLPSSVLPKKESHKTSNITYSSVTPVNDVISNTTASPLLSQPKASEHVSRGHPSKYSPRQLLLDLIFLK